MLFASPQTAQQVGALIEGRDVMCDVSCRRTVLDNQILGFVQAQIAAIAKHQSRLRKHLSFR